jgi:hypothetical protein
MDCEPTLQRADQVIGLMPQLIFIAIFHSISRWMGNCPRCYNWAG